MQRIKVLVADDRWLVHLGIRSLFGVSNEVEIVGEASRQAEVFEQLSRLVPDIVLLNLNSMGGTSAVRSIQASWPRTRVVVLADSGTETEIAAAVGEGALGCLSTDVGAEEFLRAIRQVDRGEPWLPASLSLRLLQKLCPGGHAGSSPEPLTRRESEVLRLIARGLEDREIGRSLHISKGTVRTHVSNTLGKLGLRNRVEATLYALRQGLASLDPGVSCDEGFQALAGVGQSLHSELPAPAMQRVRAAGGPPTGPGSRSPHTGRGSAVRRPPLLPP
jgi:NarL family two-component system response regulator LiaR